MSHHVSRSTQPRRLVDDAIPKLDAAIAALAALRAHLDASAADAAMANAGQAACEAKP